MNRGWGLVVALACAQLVSWGSVYYSFSLFVLPMETELGWDRTWINGALSLGLFMSGVGAYPVGRWIDRHGGRSVMTAGSVAATVLLLAWSRVESLGVFYLIWFGLGLALAATLYEPVFAVITRTFPKSYRKRITALTLVGGFASTVFIPLTQLFIAWLGWRDALVALALCNLLICVPVHGLLLKGEGGSAERKASLLEPALDEGDAVRRAFRHPVFWGLAISFTAYYTTMSALVFHMIPLLVERGLPMSHILAAVAVIGPAQVAGRTLLMAFPGGLSAAFTGRCATALFVLSVVPLIAFPESWVAPFVFAALYGGANGVVTIVRGTAVPDLLWREGYGAINGALSLPANVAKAAAPFGAAFVWTLGGGYGPVLWTLLGGAVLAAAGFWFASSPGLAAAASAGGGSRLAGR